MRTAYPQPRNPETSIMIGEMELEAGDQLRFPNGAHPITGETQYGLCYILRIDDDEVEIFNVTEEMTVTHSRQELEDSVDDLTKLDEKWYADDN